MMRGGQEKKWEGEIEREREAQNETRGSGFLDAFELVADTNVTASLFKYERNSSLSLSLYLFVSCENV